MVNPKILVSAAAGDIGSAAIRSLSEAGYRVVGCDIKAYSPVSDLIERHYQVSPAVHVDSYIEQLKMIINTEKIEMFLPISEPELEIINHWREELELLGIRLVINNKTILDHFLDKLKTIKYLEKIGIKIPKTMPLATYNNSMEYPLIVKARRGYGGKKLWRIEDSLDLSYIKQKDDGSLIIQELIGNEDEDYTTGVFSDGNVVSSITFRRKLGYGGLSIEAVLVEEPLLDDLAQCIGKETGLIGSINIQSRRIGNIFVPYEINPRLSSTLPFRKRLGFNDVVWWVNVLSGRGYFYKKIYKSGRAIRCLSECYFDVEKI